jgi:hypothetical protein
VMETGPQLRLSVPELVPTIDVGSQPIPAMHSFLDYEPAVFKKRLLRAESGGIALQDAAGDGPVSAVLPGWQGVRCAKVHPVVPMVLCVMEDGTTRALSLEDPHVHTFVCRLVESHGQLFFDDAEDSHGSGEAIAGVAWCPDESMGLAIAWVNGVVRCCCLQELWRQALAAANARRPFGPLGAFSSTLVLAAEPGVMDATEDECLDEAAWLDVMRPKGGVRGALSDSFAAWKPAVRHGSDLGWTGSESGFAGNDALAMPSGWGSENGLVLAPTEAPERLLVSASYLPSAFGWAGSQENAGEGWEAPPTPSWWSPDASTQPEPSWFDAAGAAPGWASTTTEGTFDTNAWSADWPGVVPTEVPAEAPVPAPPPRNTAAAPENDLDVVPRWFRGED